MDVTKLTDKAAIATERGNYDYAMDLYLRLLELQPNNTEARKALRAVEVRKFQERGITKSNLGAWIKGFGHLVTILISFVIRKYEKAMAACEAFLKNDPYNRIVRWLLARAAMRAGYLDTAILILEDIRSSATGQLKGMALKGHIKVLRTLGQLYAQTDKLPLANERFEEILRAAPGDREAERRIREIAALRSMSEGGWDKAGKKGGYRDVLKDEDASKRLEDVQRDIRTSGDVLNAIERVKGDLAKEPESTRHLLQLGDLYKMLKEWDQARATYERAREIDPSNFLMEERLGDLRLAEMDEEIEAIKGAESQKEHLLQLRKERMTFAFKEYQKRVRARPQDLPTRYALGSILLQIGRAKEASVQFQHASRDPKTRRPALFRLGICFQKQGLVDLAVEQFQKAVTGASLVDHEVKDILYALGEARESQGRLVEALEAYKKIFEVDINYRDVSGKIEELYKQGVRETV